MQHSENLSNTPTTGPDRVQIVSGIMLSGFMAFCFAGLFSLFALGFSVEWLKSWAFGVLIGWPLGFAIVSIIHRPIRRLAERLIQ